MSPIQGTRIARTREPFREFSKEPIKEPFREPHKEPIEEPLEDPLREPIKRPSSPLRGFDVAAEQRPLHTPSTSERMLLHGLLFQSAETLW